MADREINAQTPVPEDHPPQVIYTQDLPGEHTILKPEALHNQGSVHVTFPEGLTPSPASGVGADGRPASYTDSMPQPGSPPSQGQDTANAQQPQSRETGPDLRQTVADNAPEAG